MRVLSERNLEHNQNVYVCFVDFEKAFDRIRWDKLFEILKNIGVDRRDRKLISELYMGQTAVVRTDDGETPPIVVGRGTRQGCPLSPLLFNIYDEAMVREAFDDIKEGVKIGGKLVKEIRFADDKCVIASTAKGLQKLVSSLDKVTESYGMKISIKKTKVMQITRKKKEDLKITIKDQTLEEVDEFKYLGSMLTTDGSSQTEIRKRIAMGKQAFMKRKSLLTKSFKLNLKKRIIKTTIWSVMLYGCETWTIKAIDVQKIEAFEMWIWRKMKNIKWQDHITNEEVLRLVEEERSMIKTILLRQRQWIGHVLRRNSLLTEVLEGRCKGKKAKGRPRQQLLDNLLSDKTYEKVKREAQDRAKWKEESSRLSRKPANRQTTT